MLHFETTTTSRGEGGHAVLKRHLGASTRDLKLVVDGINLLLTNQHHDYLLAHEEAKIRYPNDLQLPVFHQLAAFVTPYAFRRINLQYQLLTERPTAMPVRTRVFTTTIGLAVIKFSNVSTRVTGRYFWKMCICIGGKIISSIWLNAANKITISFRPEKTIPPQIDAINPLLLVQEPKVIRPRGRSPEAENIIRQEAAFEASTNREPSQFERLRWRRRYYIMRW